VSLAWVALGANQGDPEAQLRSAAAALAALPTTTLQAASHIWRTPPWGIAEQPDFLNAVVRLHTALEPLALLDALLRIEHAHGRVRSAQRWGPRTLDLDLLLYDAVQMDSARLRLPHPQLAARAFVLLPLAELDADLPIPGSDATAATLLAAADTRGCRRLHALL